MPPDLTLTSQVSPSTTHGNAAIKLIIDVLELNEMPTTGLITLRISKDDSYAITFNPTASSVGGTTVQNANWNFDAISNEDYYVLTSTTIIAAGGESIIGFTGNIITQGYQGTLNISSVIAAGSGGELKIINNIASSKVNYFP